MRTLLACAPTNGGRNADARLRLPGRRPGGRDRKGVIEASRPPPPARCCASRRCCRCRSSRRASAAASGEYAAAASAAASISRQGARHGDAPDRDAGRLGHRDRGSAAPGRRRNPSRPRSARCCSTCAARSSTGAASPRRWPRIPRPSPNSTAPRSRRASIGQAARRAQPPRRIRREPAGQRPEAPAGLALSGAARDRLVRDDGDADGLCRARHRPRVRVARRRSAVAHAAADRDQLVRPEVTGCTRCSAAGRAGPAVRPLGAGARQSAAAATASSAERRPFRRFSRQLSAARFAGSLATLVGSAVPLVEALHAAAAVTPNR